MSLLIKIKESISSELQEFNMQFATAFDTANPILSSIHKYILDGDRKQLRPIVTILCAKLCGHINGNTYKSAVALELLHTASIIHDDVVDDTNERRGHKSVNARWSNKIAVLTGDYLLSKALEVAINTDNMNILHEIAHIGIELSDGEIKELSNTEKSMLSEENYYEIIREKTAILFSECAVIGGYSMNTEETTIQIFRKYGEYLGLCFQIKDDIFDYFSDMEIGKPTGNDLQDGKITLPLIFALQNADENERNQMLKIINNKAFTAQNIEKIMHFAQNSGGIQYAEQKMAQFGQNAIDALSIFPQSNTKQALIDCVLFACQRNK
ncbi:MAG: polyprenyl synthetase family protein [Paludibacter sp.]|nr:polyprenyl synthetase family protein [Paludibacter sp.]